jgi:serine/threonine-protein kinase
MGVTDEDRAFGETAVERGFCSRAQLEECLEAEKLVTRAGLRKPLSEIMVEKGFISEVQVEIIRRAVESPDVKTVAGFELLGKLGEGGMGVVYKARQVSMDRVVALKILPKRFVRDKQFVSRFFREARAAAKLDHPNVIRGIDVGSAGEDYYFAMEFVEGESVGSILKREKRLPERRALEIALQVARALGHASKHQLIHRDIKPDNILVTGAGVAKLADLGLAKSTASDVTQMTKTGMAVGTPHYISPEQARGETDVDIRTDIYSLGVTLYHMLVGAPPFDGSTVAVIITKTLTEEPTPVHRINPEVSERASRVVSKMMVKNRAARYLDPAELAEDLELVLAGKEPLHAGEPAPPSAQATLATVAAGSGQMRVISAEDLEKLKSDAVMAAARAVRRGWLLPTALAAVLVVAAGGVAALLLLGGKPRGVPAAGPPDAASAAAERKLEAEDEAAWTKAKAQAEGSLAVGDFKVALAAIDRFVGSARTARFNPAATALRAEIEAKRSEAEARRLASEAEREAAAERERRLAAEEEARRAAADELPQDVARRLLDRAADAEEAGDLKSALAFYREATRRGAGALDKIRSLEEEVAFQDGLARARGLVEREARKEARSELERLLELRPHDDAAQDLLAEVKKKLGPEPELTFDLGGGVELVMVYVRPGRFRMGSVRGWFDEKPVHEVELTRGFYIGKYEVTQAQFRRIMGMNPSRWKGDDRPVEEVSWHEAEDFAKRLSERTERRSRLPTEAEWEYAARAGTAGDYCFGNEEKELANYGWYGVNSEGQTREVGKKRPNAWGVHDMHGNVWEWCADWYDGGYYKKSPREDPAGPEEPTGKKVLRGGSYRNKASGCTSTERSKSRPDGRDGDAGFRVVMEFEP